MNLMHNRSDNAQHFRNPKPGSLSFRVSRDKAGDYQCVSSVSRRRAFASLPASLAIAQLGDFAPERDDSIEAFVGNDVVIDCRVPDSNPPAFVQFYKAREISDLRRHCRKAKYNVAIQSDSGFVLKAHWVSFYFLVLDN